MGEKLAHRGPDGEGVAFFDTDGAFNLFRHSDATEIRSVLKRPVVGLAHRRLAVIDLTEGGAQPMADATGRYWITFNGELYNYIELRDELSRSGAIFRSSSDTEVILEAYARWGSACVERFNGMFAFAIWDNRDKQLFCARDHLGVKPFCFSKSDKFFSFASEPKAIVATLPHKPELNIAAVADFLAYSYVLSDATMFRDIKQLLPGHWMLIRRGHMDIRRYWHPPTASQSDNATLDDRAMALKDLLDDSIRMQVRSDVPVGAHLSGGIDSSIVCCLAAKQVPTLKTYTAKFAEGGQYDESGFAKVVSNHIASESHEIVPRKEQVADLLPRIIYHLDQPVEAASVIGKYKVAEIVADSTKVVLGGQGGDELFGGYDWYVKSIATSILLGGDPGLKRSTRPGFVREAISHESNKRLLKSLWKSFPTNSVGEIFRQNWSRFQSDSVARLFRAETVNIDELDSASRFRAAFAEIDEVEDADKMFVFDIRNYLQALLASEDRLSMAFSIESRVPLLDFRVAELATASGFENKAIPGHSKEILRRAADGLIPRQILERRDKRGFPTPIGKWLRDTDMNLVDRFVFEDNEFANKYFDIERVRQLYRERSYWSTDSAERMWRVMAVCIWGEVFSVA